MRFTHEHLLCILIGVTLGYAIHAMVRANRGQFMGGTGFSGNLPPG